MQTSTFAIGLFGDRLEVALWRRGSQVALRRRTVALDEKTDIAQWSEAVRELGPDLREMVSEILAETNARVRRTFVLYAGPTAVGDCMSFPVRTPAQARSAASLSLMDSMQCDAEEVVCSTLFIERDAAPAPSRSVVRGTATTLKTEARAQRAHVIAAADCEQALLAIQSVVERAGLCFRGAVPIQAAIAAGALAAAGDDDSLLVATADDAGAEPPRASRSSAAATAHLHITESGSFLLIRDGNEDSNVPGNLRFTRSVPIGASALAASLMRRADATSTEADGAGVEQDEPSAHCGLDQDAARCALYDFGLPATPDAVHEATGLTARDVLPLLQPLVQRMTVELRQSLRFALDAAERSRVTFVISGCGALVPGLAAALGRELAVPAFIQQMKDSDGGGTKTAVTSDLESATGAWLSRASNSLRELALQPRELAVRLSAMRLRRGLWAGAAAALLLITIDAGRLASHLVQSQLGGDSSHMTIHPAAVAQQSPFLARVTQEPDEMIAAIEAAREFRKIVDRETARRVDFRAAMHELSRITPRSVRLTNVSFQSGAAAGKRTGDRIGATIAGVSRPSGDSPARSELERFVFELQASALFDEVALAHVHVDAEDSPDQRFELRFAALPAPVLAVRTPVENEPPGEPAAAIAAAPTLQGDDE